MKKAQTIDNLCINWQDDTGQPAGIAYDTHGSLDESTWTAVGRIGISPL